MAHTTKEPAMPDFNLKTLKWRKILNTYKIMVYTVYIYNDSMIPTTVLIVVVLQRNNVCI